MRTYSPRVQLSYKIDGYYIKGTWLRMTQTNKAKYERYLRAKFRQDLHAKLKRINYILLS